MRDIEEPGDEPGEPGEPQEEKNEEGTAKDQRLDDVHLAKRLVVPCDSFGGHKCSRVSKLLASLHH